MVAICVALMFIIVPAPPAIGAARISDGPSGPRLAAAKQCPWTACSGVLSAVAAGAKLSALPNNLSPSLQHAHSDIHSPAGLGGCVVGQPVLQTPLPCIYNSAATSKRMVLIGDSHAEMWAPAIADIASANGYSLLFLAKLPCPLPMASFWNNLNSTPDTQCTTWKKWAFTRIQQFDPSVVVATTEDFVPYSRNAVEMSQEQYSSALVTSLKDLSAPSRRVILLGDIPYLNAPGPVCLAAHESSVQSCSTPTAKAVYSTNQAAERLAAIKAGATFVNAIPWFCTPAVCPAIIAGKDVYEDGYHITATYATWLEPILTEALGLRSPQS